MIRYCTQGHPQNQAYTIGDAATGQAHCQVCRSPLVEPAIIDSPPPAFWPIVLVVAVVVLCVSGMWWWLWFGG